MPRETINDNINSKENNLDRSDIDDIINASRALSISVQNFVSAFEKFSDKFDNVSEATKSDTTTASPTNIGSSIPYDLLPFDKQTSQQVPRYSKSNHGKARKQVAEQDQKQNKRQEKWGIRVGDIVQVLNDLKVRGYVIPEQYKYGKVTHFNKRFVFFELRYKIGEDWYTEPCWREHQNLLVYRQL